MRKKRNKLVQGREFISTGPVCNPGTHLLLRFVKNVVYELNSRTTENINLARKTLSIYGLVLAKDGIWKLEQLTPELITIAKSKMAFFMVKIKITESNAK